MTTELISLRRRFGALLVWLLWAHVPVVGLIAWMAERSTLAAVLATAAVALLYHVTWLRAGTGPTTRYMSAVCMVAVPALMVFLLRGLPWQMDMHMYFFAMLALTIGWFDRRAILFAASVIVVHHLLLLYLLPFAVFPEAASLARVLLHGAIVAFQSAVLVLVSETVVEKFAAVEVIGQELRASNSALEERSREAEQASATKSMFLANMSHEIRTPLNAVLGFCHLLQRTQLNSKQEDYVNKISGSGTALLRLINDILDYSKNEAGKLELEHRPFSMQSAIEQQLQMVIGDAKMKGVNLHLEHDTSLPALLSGDELRFGQVVLNLVSNAVKFTESGSVTVRTRLISESDTQVRVGLDVIDTGIGMTPEQQERLFNSFTQADNTMTRRFGGTGLGLAIARQIVQTMGGDISVRSVQWSGTTFSLQADFAQHTGELVELTSLHPALRRLRVLAVDDNPASRQIIRETFADWSVQVDTSSSASEAIESLEAASEVGRDYDLLLLDWKMPGIDGLTAARMITENKAILKKPKMVVLTAYGSDEFTAEVGLSGIAAYLTKPLETRALLETLEDLFLTPTDLARTAAPAAPRQADPVTQVPPAVQGLRVLLVEDNEINREIATELLTDAGLLVDVAENGLLACKQIEREGDSYSAVLMDIQMPVMDGMDATRRIRETWTADKLPIIAMTAHTYAEERQRCLDAGMNDHIAKPVDPKVLVRTLSEHLRPRRSGGIAPLVQNRDAATPADELPDRLPPFNIARALERVNGKRPLLRRLILNFGETQSRAGDEIRSLIAEGAMADARRVSHTLKGLAGSLELPDLQEAAAKLERALLEGEPAQLHALIMTMEEHLAPAIAAAARLKPADPVPGSTPPSDPAAPPERLVPTVAPDVLETKIAQMREQIQRRSLGARMNFAGFAAALGLSPAATEQHPVKKALDRLDYEAAMAAFNAMDLDGLSVPGVNPRE
ncbi:response regulator [Falsigemmobacter faecalis]|uniref:histidine kinase n=1 Tax=Falsigemmobacter faecalis TaxID=2488730 RepID=A0A3P3DV70_9RHOB|nr:response regulator [Falsigemmobacter faecalis]RRH78173.1 response regulator [Falsigemmobacter faecalis]